MSQDAAFYLDPLRDIYEARLTTLRPNVVGNDQLTCYYRLLQFIPFSNFS